MALIFLNRYLDIAEAIEDGLTHIDLRPIQGASVPNRIPLLRKQSIGTRLKDEVTHLRAIHVFQSPASTIIQLSVHVAKLTAFLAGHEG